MNHHPKIESLDPDWDFASRRSIEQVEEGFELAPKFDASGTLPCITQHVESGEILMFAFMNKEGDLLVSHVQRISKIKFATYWTSSFTHYGFTSINDPIHLNYK